MWVPYRLDLDVHALQRRLFANRLSLCLFVFTNRVQQFGCVYRTNHTYDIMPYVCCISLRCPLTDAQMRMGSTCSCIETLVQMGSERCQQAIGKPPHNTSNNVLINTRTHKETRHKQHKLHTCRRRMLGSSDFWLKRSAYQ